MLLLTNGFLHRVLKIDNKVQMLNALFDEVIKLLGLSKIAFVPIATQYKQMMTLRMANKTHLFPIDYLDEVF